MPRWPSRGLAEDALKRPIMVECNAKVTKFKVEVLTEEDVDVILSNSNLRKEMNDLVEIMIQSDFSGEIRNDSMICYAVESKWAAMATLDVLKNGVALERRMMSTDDRMPAMFTYQIRLLQPYTSNEDEELNAFMEEDSVASAGDNQSKTHANEGKSKGTAKSSTATAAALVNKNKSKKKKTKQQEASEYEDRPTHGELKQINRNLPIDQQIRHICQPMSQADWSLTSTSGEIDDTTTVKEQGNVSEDEPQPRRITRASRKADSVDKSQPPYKKARLSKKGRSSNKRQLDVPKHQNTVRESQTFSPRLTRRGTKIDPIPTDAVDEATTAGDFPSPVKEGGRLTDLVVTPMKALGRMFGIV